MTTGVGLLGCGAIGQELARAIQAGEAGGAYLAALFDQVEGLAASVAGDLGGGVLGTDSMGDFLAAPGLDLVVECASPHAVRAHAEAVLSAGKDLLMMSSGALADPDLAERLSDLAQREQRRLIVPSGALGGIDAIRERGDDSSDADDDQGPRWCARVRRVGPEISEPTVVFDGPAIEAVKLFPANVNVAATLSLAGWAHRRREGRGRPRLDSQRPRGRGGRRPGHTPFRMELLPHERNPKTSFLAIVSAVEALRDACTPGINRHLAHGARARLCSPVVPAKPESSNCVEGQALRVPPSVVLDHGVQDRQQLAHARCEHHFLPCPGRRQERTQYRVAAHRGERR